ncbi:MAG TPA: DUF1684 domain-containing protein [Chloroflexota bacterium]|jgi:hypothetical protein
MGASAYLELLDWRRRVAEIFAEVRRRPADAATVAWFRAQKDDLYQNHPQSPIPKDERPAFGGLPYWPFDPEARVVAHFVPDERPPGTAAVPAEVAFHRIGILSFELHQQPLRLPALWIDGYAGGLFVPFKDATSGHQTYGGGRYLLDTIKSCDLNSDVLDATVILDFNYAYHPSCAYDPVWVCPLAPPESRLPVPIEAGEQSR